MKNLDLFALILRQTKMVKFLVSFLIVYVIGCLLIWWIDPSVTTFSDALWFGFTVATTIGFGDFTVVSVPGRLIVAVIGLYGILCTGFICGIGASWFLEKVRAGQNETVSEMIWQLEHLDTLSDEQIHHLAMQADLHQKAQQKQK